MATDGGHVFFSAIWELSRAMRRRFVAMATEHDLTLPQWRVLGRLAYKDGITQRALADLSDTDPMTLGQILERLEAKGLVKREPDPNDGRARIVRLTENANETTEEMRQVAAGVYASAMSGLNEDECRTLLLLLQRVSANLVAARDEPGK